MKKECVNILELYKQYGIPIDFKYYEPNPLISLKQIPGLTSDHRTIGKRNDCSTRAMTAATGRDYRDIQAEQLKLAAECFVMPNSFHIMTTIMKENGFQVFELRNIVSLYLMIMKYHTGVSTFVSMDHAVTVIDSCVYDNIKIPIDDPKFNPVFDHLLYMPVKAYYRKVQ